MPSSPVNIKYPIVPPVFGSFKPFVTAYDQPNAVEQFFNHQMPVQSSSSNHGALRRLTWQQEVLDSFRRGWQRGDCAVKVTLRGRQALISAWHMQDTCAVLSQPYKSTATWLGWLTE